MTGTPYFDRSKDRMKEEFVLLGEENLTEMAELYRKAFAGDPWNDDWSDTEQLMEYIREISGSYHSLHFGLRIDGKLAAVSIGMIRHWWEGTNYNLEELYVDPDYQGQGIGTRFMQQITEEIRGRGLAGIFLQTDNDKPAFRFYHKNGFDDLEAHVSLYKNIRK